MRDAPRTAPSGQEGETVSRKDLLARGKAQQRRHEEHRSFRTVGGQSSIVVAAAAADENFDLLSINRVPISDEERRAVAVLVSQRVEGILEARLSAAESALWVSSQSEVKLQDTPDGNRLLSKLDNVIIEQAATRGWRVLLSDSIVLYRLRRYNDIEKRGPKRLERFAAALVHNAQAIRKERRAYMGAPELYPTRQNSLREIRALSNKFERAPLDAVKASGRY